MNVLPMLPDYDYSPAMVCIDVGYNHRWSRMKFYMVYDKCAKATSRDTHVHMYIHGTSLPLPHLLQGGGPPLIIKTVIGTFTKAQH
jgi:hypothetical protein